MRLQNDIEKLFSRLKASNLSNALQHLDIYEENINILSSKLKSIFKKYKDLKKINTLLKEKKNYSKYSKKTSKSTR